MLYGGILLVLWALAPRIVSAGLIVVVSFDTTSTPLNHCLLMRADPLLQSYT